MLLLCTRKQGLRCFQLERQPLIEADAYRGHVKRQRLAVHSRHIKGQRFARSRHPQGQRWFALVLLRHLCGQRSGSWGYRYW